MNKRTLLFITILVFAVGAVGAFLFMKNQPEEATEPETEAQQSLLTSNHYAEARTEPTNGVTCLDEDSAIDISAEERTDIEYTSMAHLYDVPAGTELDVKIATYSNDKVTGSNLYEGDYGNYNFVLTKQNNEWAVTEYQRCEM